MKRQRVDIKKIIKKKIEARHQKLTFIERGNTVKDSFKKPMNERNLLRVNLVTPSGNLTNLGSADRVALRTGTFISEDVMNEIFEYSPPTNKEKKVNDANDLIFAITTYNRINFLKKTINMWYETINKKYNWTLIIADDNSSDGTFEYIQNLALEGVKIYLIKNENRGVHHQQNQLLRIMLHLDFDVAFKSDDDVLFLKNGWDDLYINAIKETGYDHLIFYDKTWGNRRKELRTPIFKDNLLENNVAAVNIQGAFQTFTKRVIKEVGFIDTKNFNVCGYGHVDYSLRCCRLGFNDINNPFDAKDSNEYIKLNTEKYISHNARYSNLWNTPKIVAEKRGKLLNEHRLFIPFNVLNKKVDGNNVQEKGGYVGINNEINFINEYFDHIYCINLDRRPEKWESVKRKFNDLNIIAERFSGVDGKYLPEKFQHIGFNRNAIGCMLSHFNIIKDAKRNEYKRILILEDDIIFINDFHIKFLDSIKKCNNWKLLYLGATQYYWDDVEIIDGFYHSRKCDGTFAYAVDESAFDDILNTKNIRNNKPIDNRLWSVQGKYYNDCYVCFPNLIVSDVSISDIRASRDNEKYYKKMRVNLGDYQV